MVLDWAEKYRPKRMADMVGNPAALKSLADWAEAWGKPGSKKRAALLVGRPGIGKTTAAHALATERRWSVVELNASDQRNASSIKDVATRGSVYETFSRDGEFRTAARGERKLIILDEADNVTGREDKGGYRAIVDLVRETRQPIVLVANDYYEMRRKAPALDNLCLVLKFEAPRRQSISKRLGEIAALEGKAVSAATLDSIAERCGGDMRSAVNDLQTALTGGGAELGETSLAALGARDVQLSPFDAVRRVLAAKDFKKARQAARDLDEEPADFLTWMEHNVSLAFENPADVEAAYAALARADVFITRAEKTKNYGFWSYGNDMMTAGVAAARRAPLRQNFRYEFPTWIRMMGGSKGKRAVRRSLSLKLAFYTHSSSAEVLLESMPLYASIFGGKGSGDLRRNLLSALSLSEEEVAYLLDVTLDSDDVARVLEEGRRMAAMDAKEEKPAQPADGSQPKQEKRAQRSLGEF